MSYIEVLGKQTLDAVSPAGRRGCDRRASAFAQEIRQDKPRPTSLSFLP
jgi:hypothetical protein